MNTNLTKAIRIISDLNPELPIQTLYGLLLIADEHPHCVYQQELVAKMRLSQSGVSRNLSALSKWSWLKRPGLDLIQTEEDPMDRRRRFARLTPKGVAFMKKLKAALGETEEKAY